MMTITITTGSQLSDEEKAILAVLLGNADISVAADVSSSPEDAETEEEPTPAKTPRRTTAKDRRAAQKAKEAAKAAPEPEPEPEPEDDDEDDDEDVIGGDEPTMEDAVKRATELVGQGKTAEVKAALGSVGVKRVSELKGDAIRTFLDAVAD